VPQLSAKKPHAENVDFPDRLDRLGPPGKSGDEELYSRSHFPLPFRRKLLNEYGFQNGVALNCLPVASELRLLPLFAAICKGEGRNS
jgi:hypothetical protein